jgi:predicted ATPase
MATRSNFFILTGASGSGKSSILDGLASRGHLCVQEMGRQVVRDEVNAGSDGTPWQNEERFIELVLARSIEAFRAIEERSRPVFFDRGIPECIGSALAADQPPLPHRLRATQTFRYNPMVFVTPPWPDIYVNDAERRHSFEQGVQYHRAELAAYLHCGYRLVEVPRGPVADRVAFVLEHVRNEASA